MTTTTEHAARHLYATWASPCGQVHPVGLLTRYESPPPDRHVSFRFVYLKVAEQLDGFDDLSGLPDLHRVYESECLFPVFWNRQMRRRRPDYPEYLRKLNLPPDTEPFEAMARSEGWKLTDPFGVFAPPERTPNGGMTTVFFARGIRNLEGAIKALSNVHPGERLTLVDELENPANPQAVLLTRRNGEMLGRVPNYLADMIRELREFFSTAVAITVEHVNSRDTAGLHQLLLCRLRAPWPEGYEPLSGPEYQPIVTA